MVSNLIHQALFLLLAYALVASGLKADANERHGEARAASAAQLLGLVGEEPKALRQALTPGASSSAVPVADDNTGFGHVVHLTASAMRRAGSVDFGCGSFGNGHCGFAAALIQTRHDVDTETRSPNRDEPDQVEAFARTVDITEDTGAISADSWNPGDPLAMSHKGRMTHVWHSDMWPGKNHTARKDGDEGFNFFTSAPPTDWIVLIVVSVVLCLADWFIFRKAPETFTWHVALIGIWIFVAALYNIYIYRRMGNQKAFEWCTGYLLEWMLSMDNLFVFHLIFSAYKTPYNQIHKAVFVGIVGAVVMRLVFFMVVSTLLHVFGWFRWPFGCLLVWSGIEAARADDDDDEADVEDTRLIRALKWCLGSRLSPKYDEKDQACFIWDEDGRLRATILVVVICVLEFTDILFALDSVSAKIAQIPDNYIAFSSSVVAMFGLRAMFFIIKDLVDMFDVLKYGLCLILVFIGVELMFSRWLKLASSTVCIMIVSVFAICIAGSHAKKKLIGKKEEPESEDDENNKDTQENKDMIIDKKKASDFSNGPEQFAIIQQKSEPQPEEEQAPTDKPPKEAKPIKVP